MTNKSSYRNLFWGTFHGIIVTSALLFFFVAFYQASQKLSQAAHTAGGAWVENPAITGCNHCHNVQIRFADNTTRRITYSPANGPYTGALRNNWTTTVNTMVGKGCPVADKPAAIAYLNSCYKVGVTNPTAIPEGPAPSCPTAVSDTSPPSTPTNLIGVADSLTQITLNWAASTDNIAVTGYNIYRDFGTTPIGTSTTETYTNTGLTPNTSYTYEVEAFDAAGNKSAKSAALTIVSTPAADPPPSIPTNITGVTDITGTKVFLTWTKSIDNIGVAAYNIYRDGGLTPVGTSATPTFLDTGLAPSTVHTYRIEAVDSVGTPSPLSQTFSILTKTVGQVNLVSLSSDGIQGNDISDSPAIRGDGRYAAFSSVASNLVPNDTNGKYDIFLRDLYSGFTERVSVDSMGTEANDFSGAPALSDDARYVVFYSLATNLIPDDLNNRYDIFVRDRQTGTTDRVSVANDGSELNDDSIFPSSSDDASKIAFESQATNTAGTAPLAFSATSLAPLINNHIYVRDRVSGTTSQADLDSSGALANNGSTSADISGSSRYVAFISKASNLVVGDTNGAEDIFVRDLQTGTTERVNVSSAGAQANDFSSSPSISWDGQYVAFHSRASNLVAGDTNGQEDVFIHDRLTGVTERVLGAGGIQTTGGYSNYPSISRDGRYVAFSSTATNLLTNPGTAMAAQVYLYDRQTGMNVRISENDSGIAGDQGSGWQGISQTVSGRTYVTFSSVATNLVLGDTNAVSDVFIRLGLTDADNDGWDVVVDCNDNDNTIYPGAPEILNDGIDQDCSGSDLSSRLTAISTRAFIGTGANVEIGGFIIQGTTPKAVLIRARGPALSGAPFNIPGTLANPTVQIFSGPTAIAQNNDWETPDPLCGSPAVSCNDPIPAGMDPCQPNPGQSVAPPGCHQESATVVTLPPGPYTAIVSGVGGATGVGIVEVYEVSTTYLTALTAISTRAFVGTGANVEIGGFIIDGTTTKKVLIRARGPALSGAPFNIPGTLANPTVQIFSGQKVIAQNNDWETADPLCSAISCNGPIPVGMDPCQPNPGQSVAPPGCSQEAATVVTLAPGPYTAIVSGVGGTTGVGIVEVYEVP